MDAAGAAAGLTLLLLLCHSTVSFSTSSDAVGERHEEGDRSPQWRALDYFVLSLQWPGTVCRGTRHCCPSNGCCSRSVPLSEFTTHGLWPEYNDGTWPACCSHSDFDIKKILALFKELKMYWPSLSCSAPSTCHGGKGIFWAHEWEKHGTCSLPIIKGEYDYFSTVLDLYHKYNITRVLDDAGFLSGSMRKYQLADIIFAVKRAIGAFPSFVCTYGAIEEIHLCFNKNFKPCDCPLGVYALHNLPQSKPCPRFVSFPKYGHLVTKGGSSSSMALL